MKFLPVATAVLLAACSGQPTTNAVTPSANDAAALNTAEEVPISEGDVVPTAEDAPQNVAAGETDRYVGRWRGVEGMYLNVAEKAGGGLALDMQWDLDNKGKFEGTATPEGIRFTRNGTAEIARPTDGDATGLKWLAGKTDCLTVKSGEGYCRD